MSKNAERVIVALDTPDLSSARSVVEKLSGRAVWYKVGMELFYAAGWDAVDMVSSSGARVFLDLKFNDIPNTVAGACRSCTRPGVAMLDLHASAGSKAMRLAVAEVKAASDPQLRPLLIGITVLTSFDEASLEAELGVCGSVEASVVRLARLCQTAGLDGVVASPLEVAAIKAATSEDFKVITPGVRPVWAAAGDQKRFTTPKQAISSGADYVVIGRPIVASPDPKVAFDRVIEELAD